MKNKQLSNNSIALHLYAKLIPVQLLTKVTVSICAIITTLLINYSLGETGLSQYKVVEAFTNLVVIFGILISAGEILLMGRAICKGEKEKVNSVFLSVVLVSAIFGIIVSVVCVVFGKEICTFFGADSDMLSGCYQTLLCSIPYYIALPICSVLLSLFQIKSDLKTPIIGSVITFVLNTFLSFLFLVVLKKDIQFVAVACSVAQIASLIFLFICNQTKKTISIKFNSFTYSTIALLIAAGVTETSVTIFSSVKNSIVIKIIAAVGGVKALSINSIICSIDAVTFGIFGSAFPFVTLMIAGIYIHEADRNSLKRFAKTAFGLGISIALVLSAIMFISAYPVAKLYNVEDVATYVFCQRMYSFAFPSYMIFILFVTMFAVLDRKKLVNIISFFTALILPTVIIGVFGYFFGIKGLYIGWALGDFSSIVVVFSYIIAKNKHFPRSIDELLCLEKDFGVEKDKTFNIKISNLEEATNASKQIIDFCKKQQIDERTSFISGLCMEEIAVNIVEHGFRKNNGKGTAELIVVNLPDSVKLIVRDNCKEFDLTEKLQSYDENDKTKGIGIRIVMGLADVTYKNMYGLNILTLKINK